MALTIITTIGVIVMMGLQRRETRNTSDTKGGAK
jgi:hypothetical protein